MNNKVGLKNLFEHKEALTLLARYVQWTLSTSCLALGFFKGIQLQVNNAHPAPGDAGGSQADGGCLLGNDLLTLV